MATSSPDTIVSDVLPDRFDETSFQGETNDKVEANNQDASTTDDDGLTGWTHLQMSTDDPEGLVNEIFSGTLGMGMLKVKGADGKSYLMGQLSPEPLIGQERIEISLEATPNLVHDSYMSLIISAYEFDPFKQVKAGESTEDVDMICTTMIYRVNYTSVHQETGSQAIDVRVLDKLHEARSKEIRETFNAPSSFKNDILNFVEIKREPGVHYAKNLFTDKKFKALAGDVEKIRYHLRSDEPITMLVSNGVLKAVSDQVVEEMDIQADHTFLKRHFNRTLQHVPLGVTPNTLKEDSPEISPPLTYSHFSMREYELLILKAYHIEVKKFIQTKGRVDGKMRFFKIAGCGMRTIIGLLTLQRDAMPFIVKKGMKILVNPTGTVDVEDEMKFYVHETSQFSALNDIVGHCDAQRDKKHKVFKDYDENVLSTLAESDKWDDVQNARISAREMPSTPVSARFEANTRAYTREKRGFQIFDQTFTNQQEQIVLGNDPVSCPARDCFSDMIGTADEINTYISDVVTQLGKVLKPGQREALEKLRCLKTQHLILEGSAGSGKTTLLIIIAVILTSRKFKVKDENNLTRNKILWTVPLNVLKHEIAQAVDQALTAFRRKNRLAMPVTILYANDKLEQRMVTAPYKSDKKGPSSMSNRIQLDDVILQHMVDDFPAAYTLLNESEEQKKQLFPEIDKETVKKSRLSLAWWSLRRLGLSTVGMKDQFAAPPGRYDLLKEDLRQMLFEGKRFKKEEKAKFTLRLSHVFADVIWYADVVVSTVNLALDSNLWDSLHPTAMFNDEASMLKQIEYLGLLDCYSTAKLIVLSGDAKQSKPFTLTDPKDNPLYDFATLSPFRRYRHSVTQPWS